MAFVQQYSNSLLAKAGRDAERVFFPSSQINVFPCSRRGQYDLYEENTRFYDPEARLNTERTNRIHTAINGFTDKFIKDFDANTLTLTFVLAGYYIEVRNFNPANIADALGTNPNSIYAHLSLHDNISLGNGYSTEILYRQWTENITNFLDTTITDESTKKQEDFFVGVSFTDRTSLQDTINEGTQQNYDLVGHDLELFTKLVDADTWQLVQTSLLPKIEHDESDNSIKVGGDFTVKHGEQTSFKVTRDTTLFSSPTAINNLTITNTLEVNGTATIEGATAVNNTLTAKKVVISNIDESGIDKGEIVTPKLRVNTITSNDGSIIVDDKKLTVTKSLEVLAKKAIDEEDRQFPATATIDKVVIGQLDVIEDNTKLTESTGIINAKEVIADMITQNGNQVPMITLEQISDKDVTPELWQLQIAHVIKLPKN